MKKLLFLLALAGTAFAQNAAVFVPANGAPISAQLQNFNPSGLCVASLQVYNYVTGHTFGCVGAPGSMVYTDITAATSGGVAWGGISGTLGNQPDLVAALALKAANASPTFTGTVTAQNLTVTGVCNGCGTGTSGNAFIYGKYSTIPSYSAVYSTAQNMFGVTDSTSASTCGPGGGSYLVQCQATSSGWVVVSASPNVANALGNLPVANLNGGTGASLTTYWRGDGTWATPAGGGGNANTVTGQRSYTSTIAPLSDASTNATATAAATTISVASTTGYPATGFLLLNMNAYVGELVSYTGTTATSFTGLTRGLYGTTGTALNSGSLVCLITDLDVATTANYPKRLVFASGGTFLMPAGNAMGSGRGQCPTAGTTTFDGQVNFAANITFNGGAQIVGDGSAGFIFKNSSGVTIAALSSAGTLATPQSTPASSSATCSVGQAWDDATYHYSCTAANTIKRIAYTTF